MLPDKCPHHPYSGDHATHHWGRRECPVCHIQLSWTAPADYMVRNVLYARKECPGCGALGHVHLMQTVQISGERLVYWHCDHCDRRVSNSLPHPDVRRYLAYLSYRYPDRQFPSDIEDIRINSDFRDGEPCFVCSQHTTGTEYHHFMPQVFKDHPEVAPNWERWEMCGIRLCRTCHKLWHELVAPMHELARAK